MDVQQNKEKNSHKMHSYDITEWQIKIFRVEKKSNISKVVLEDKIQKHPTKIWGYGMHSLESSIQSW